MGAGLRFFISFLTVGMHTAQRLAQRLAQNFTLSRKVAKFFMIARKGLAIVADTKK